MKVAILFSGSYGAESSQSNVKMVIQSLSDVFSDHETHMFFTTWKSEPAIESEPLSWHGIPVKRFDDPKFKYYPRIVHDLIAQQRRHNNGECRLSEEQIEANWVSIRGRQKYWKNLNGFLGYAKAFEYYADELNEYDVVVRARYDLLLNPHGTQKLINFLLKNTLRTGRVQGLGPPPFDSNGNRLIRWCQSPIFEWASDTWIYDHCIIHRPRDYDPTKIHKLYNEKKLEYGELTWAEIFLKPNPRRHFINIVFPMMKIPRFPEVDKFDLDTYDFITKAIFSNCDEFSIGRKLL
jgi:hypothetical protein